MRFLLGSDDQRDWTWEQREREREREKGGAVFLNKTALRAVIIDSIRLLYEREKAPHLLTHCTWQEILGQKRHNIEIANGGVETRTSGIYVEVGKQGRSICGICTYVCLLFAISCVL